MAFSLMNGLSSLGAGVAQYAGTAGLELQKADLAKQSLVLADQLATTRETGLQVSGGVIAAAAADKAQAAQAANVATEQAGANTRNAATIAGSAANTAATEAGANARNYATLHADPPEVRLLRALGVPIPGAAASSDGSAPAPSGGTPSGSGTSLPGPRTTGGTAADGSVVAPSGSGPTPSAPGGSSGTSTAGSGASGALSAAAPPAVDIQTNPIVQKALGYPAAGSEDALRRAVAADVKSDPAFKYQTAGQQAVETELRVNVAKGTMTSPATQQANATLIASYQIKPPDGFALTRQGGAETMAMVQKINPDYQESRFPEVNKGMAAFGTGKQGDITRSLNVGVQHLALFDQAAQAIGNGNIQALNSLKNTFQSQFGVAAPTTLDGLKQIVATEIEKSVAGGIGSAGDRDRLIKSLDGAKSPAQLQDMTNSFRGLMAGQLDGLRTQYVDATGFKTGPFAFENKLGPDTAKVLQAHSGTSDAPAAPAASTATPAVPSWVRPGDSYSPARGMARASDGSVYGAPPANGASGAGLGR